MPEETSQADLENFLRGLNTQADVHGVLLQMPLPPHLDKLTALNTITPHKDVDGLTDANHLALEHNRPDACHPCTPLGIMRLLRWVKVPVKGKNVVIVGRSRIVGKPLATLMNHADATVTLCHSHTTDLKHHLKRADIIVAAAGSPNLVTGDDIKAGAVVIDVGINSYTDAAGVRRLHGDCDYASCAAVARFITPVPGGVGPMTVISLMTNMVDLTCRQAGLALFEWQV
jgi:methylenetetrahydrofolate dehydrogenase (NADP+)/methenyltetrahydrofolate cyclohydrolase